MSSVSSESINRNLSQEEYYFEGVEKVLEMWFHIPQDGAAYPHRSCRDIPEQYWCQVLDKLGAKILSKCGSVHWDSYVLSESSLFVSDTKVILKTCGSTTLLLALDHLLHVIKTNISHDAQIFKLFYNRKSMLRPDCQLYPHCNINEENLFLKSRFPSGRFNIVDFNKDKTNDFWAYFIYENEGLGYLEKTVDCTFEVMMTGLSEEKCSIFVKKPSGGEQTLPQSSPVTALLDTSQVSIKNLCDSSPEQSVSLTSSQDRSMSAVAGIFDIFPGCLLDDFEFEPCGYSMNGLFKQYYQTIHVTPEPSFSYASYETNQDMDDSLDSCVKAVETFMPDEFVFTGFVPAGKSTLFIEDFGKKLSARFMGRFRLVHSQVDCTQSNAVLVGCAKFERTCLI